MSRAGTPRIPLDEATEIAKRLRQRLEPRFSRVEIAGSVRRQSKTVGDIDLVVCGNTIDYTQDVIARALCGTSDKVYIESNPEKLPRNAYFVIFEDGSSIGVDVWVIRPESFGSALMHCTGSLSFNVLIRRLFRAKGMNLDLNGVHRDGLLSRMETELDVFDAAGLKFIPPTDREFGFDPPQYLIDLIDEAEKEHRDGR